VSEIPASEELIELIFAALDHGIESVRDGGPLIPFLITESEDGRELMRFAAETLEEGQAQARRHAKSSGAERVALAFDGYLTVDDERSDAVFVEAHEQGAASSVVFAQRYRPASRLRKFSTVGNPAFTGAGGGLF
jgi:hypothetical protein